jgi:hypothetical protein
MAPQSMRAGGAAGGSGRAFLNAIQVSHRQTGNPVLRHIRAVRCPSPLSSFLNAIQVSHRQTGNPVLRHIRAVRCPSLAVVCSSCHSQPMSGSTSAARVAEVGGGAGLSEPARELVALRAATAVSHKCHSERLLPLFCLRPASFPPKLLRWWVGWQVRWEFAEIIPDFMVGASACCLFLSLRYHLLHPDYVYNRIRQLTPASFRLKVVLCHVDVDVRAPTPSLTRPSQPVRNTANV